MNDIIWIDLILLAFVSVAAIAVIRAQSLFSAVILSGVYSLLMAMVWTNMRALDVAFTEASVGAGISTVLLLGALVWCGREEKASPPDLRAIALVLVTGAVLIYGTFDMPAFGDPNAAIHQHRVPELLAQTVGKHLDAPTYYDIQDPAFVAHAHHVVHPLDDFAGHVTNTVTSLLAAYRSFDTMFETTVIFTAGIALVLLLRRRPEDVAQGDALSHRPRRQRRRQA